jgi:hypothetical protein
VLWVGGALQGNSDAGSRAAVWRLDGNAWTEIVRSPLAAQPYRAIGYSDSEVYIGRRDDIARWNGVELISISVDGVDADACSSSTGASPTDIWLGRCRIASGSVTLVDFQARWGTSETDMWTVGFRNGQAFGYVARSNGVGVVELPNEVEADLMGVWGASATDVWVVGTQGALVHYAP